MDRRPAPNGGLLFRDGARIVTYPLRGKGFRLRVPRCRLPTRCYLRVHSRSTRAQIEYFGRRARVFNARLQERVCKPHISHGIALREVMLVPRACAKRGSAEPDLHALIRTTDE